MSEFTTELRYICESLFPLNKSKGYNSVNEIINTVFPKIFDFDYPIFDTKYKSILEPKIIKHFYTYEIGAETVGLWKLYLDSKMNEIMPYYNKLYNSELIKYEPLEDTNLTRHSNRDEIGKKDDLNEFKGNTIDNTKTNLNNLNKFWDTPQNGLQALTEGTYLTDARNVTENNSTDYTSNITNHNTFSSLVQNNDDFWETIKGKQSNKSYSEMINELRSTFLNIDLMVIKELNPLFMGIWRAI